MSKEDVPFRALLAYRTFQKSGRTLDVDFFESDYFQKAANEADLDRRIKEAVKQTNTTGDDRDQFERLDEWLEGADDELD